VNRCCVLVWSLTDRPASLLLGGLGAVHTAWHWQVCNPCVWLMPAVVVWAGGWTKSSPQQAVKYMLRVFCAPAHTAGLRCGWSCSTSPCQCVAYCYINKLSKVAFCTVLSRGCFLQGTSLHATTGTAATSASGRRLFCVAVLTTYAIVELPSRLLSLYGRRRYMLSMKCCQDAWNVGTCLGGNLSLC
jgi:hypothetical protein